MAEHREPVIREGKEKKLDELVAQAGEHYTAKNYAAAADDYGYACAIQAELNGELANENAELLFKYGRSLYRVGIESSDVLGTNVGPATEASEPKSTMVKSEPDTEHAAAENGALGGDAILRPIPGRSAATPVLQFQGDENWDEPKAEEDANEDAEESGGDAAEGGEDSFALAWNTLELARLLTRDQLVNCVADCEAPKESEPRHIRERQADTYDLLAEIELEHERFGDAVNDLLASLAFKEDLYPHASGIVAEAHYKLSLAYEFASHESTDITLRETGLSTAMPSKSSMRALAVKHMNTAISSASARVEEEERLLERPMEERETQGKGSLKQDDVQEVKDIIVDMKQRLLELRRPPVSVRNEIDAAASADGSNSLAGILGSLIEASPEERRAKLQEVMNGANDLSKLVKRSKPAVASEAANVAPRDGAAMKVEDTVNSKRKAGHPKGEEVVEGSSSSTKRIKTESSASP